MDEIRHGYSPTLPDLDDHLVEPEVTRDEVIGGRWVVAGPNEAPVATQHSRLNYVIRGLRVDGYQGSINLLTRFAADSDFSNHVSLRRAGLDPATGTRYLEEIVFNVISQQNECDVLAKAPYMYRRGVRRIFALFVEGEWLAEWSGEMQGWRMWEREALIEDQCFAVPLPVRALFEASAADDAVVEALAAKGNPVIRRFKRAARARGRAEALAKAILVVLEAREVEVLPHQRQEILVCRDLARLTLWLRRSVVASSAAEVTAEP